MSDTSERGAVTAINILLEPDATMRERAAANNARLLEVFPHGFTFDSTHHPHITLLQRFVRTADLEELYAAVGQAVASTNVAELEHEAYRYYYIPSGAIGLAGIVAKPHPPLKALQRALIDVVAPFTVATGGSDAFFTTPEDPVIDPMLIGYVSTYVPDSIGDDFSPHVTTGIASRDYLDAMLAEPFDSFGFSVTNVAAFQLGQYGTAAKKLHEWGSNV